MKKEDFRLKKLVFKESLGLEVYFQERVEAHGAKHWNENSIKSNVNRHVDMIKLVDELNIHLLRSYDIFDQIDKLEKLTGTDKTKFKQCVDEVTIISITLKGDDDIWGAIISGKTTIQGNQSVVLNSPTINFDDSSTFKHGDKLEKIVKKLINEVFKYLTEAKTSENVLEFEGAAEESAKNVVDEVLT